jgi:hypothetical protein
LYGLWTRFGVKWSAAKIPRLGVKLPYEIFQSVMISTFIYYITPHIMEEDTRKTSNTISNDTPAADGSAPWRKKPKHDFPKTQAGKMWEAFGNPAEPVNEMPGGTYNSAGGKPKEVTWKDAFSWEWNDVKRFYKVPCARDALLVGLGGGAAVGGVSAIIGGNVIHMHESVTPFTHSQQ